MRTKVGINRIELPLGKILICLEDSRSYCMIFCRRWGRELLCFAKWCISELNSGGGSRRSNDCPLPPELGSLIARRGTYPPAPHAAREGGARARLGGESQVSGGALRAPTPELPDVLLYRVLPDRPAVGGAKASRLPAVLQRFPEVRPGGRPRGPLRNVERVRR